MKSKIITLLLAAVITVLLLSGCSKTASGPSGSTVKKNADSNSAVSEQTIFHFYNLVKLDQTKDEVDKELGTPGRENTDYKGTYDYIDGDSSYGVGVLYTSDNKVMAKTVTYESHADIAPFCKKPVTNEQASKIANKMTYEQVKDLLGGEGIEVNETKIGDDKVSTIRRWANSDGSCIQISFGIDETVSSSLFYAG